jgi:hypothetical protein
MELINYNEVSDYSIFLSTLRTETISNLSFGIAMFKF